MISKKYLDQTYCKECDDLVDYTIKNTHIKETFRGKEIGYDFECAYCKNCGTEVCSYVGYPYDKSEAKLKAFSLLKEQETRNENNNIHL